MSKILVTGGCGYIGSHTVVDLIDNGFEVITIDNFINSDPKVLKAIEEITGKKIKNYAYDLTDERAVRSVFAENPDIAGVIHFAALIYVNESVHKPIWYFQNNLFSLINITKVMVANKVPNLIFSSSCSVYGQSKALPVSETTPLEEVHCPYARTKVMGEEILTDIAYAEKGLNALLLRYFNPAGAHTSNKMGDYSEGSTRLVPVITEKAIGKRASMHVFGDDYDTRDGSAVRDYIHVMDIANAHTKAIQYLEAKKNKTNCEVFNLGIGQGVTVLEAIKAFEKTAGIQLEYQVSPRREGDVAAVYADRSRSEKYLGWKPQFGIDEIMKTAWDWEKMKANQA